MNKLINWFKGRIKVIINIEHKEIPAIIQKANLEAIERVDASWISGNGNKSQITTENLV